MNMEKGVYGGKGRRMIICELVIGNWSDHENNGDYRIQDQQILLHW